MTPEKLCKDYPKVFISRTLEILQQYEDIVMDTVSEEKCYDATLLINCFYGLLMMPAKLNRNSLENEKDANAVLREHQLDTAITFTPKPPIHLSFKSLVDSIRNGLAHWEDKPNEDPKRQELGVEYEPKEENLQMEKIIIHGSTKKDNGIDTVVTFDIESEDNRKKVMEFLKLVYTPSQTGEN